MNAQVKQAIIVICCLHKYTQENCTHTNKHPIRYIADYYMYYINYIVTYFGIFYLLG